MLMPPDLRDWVPENHIVRFIIELIERFDLSTFRVNERGTGSAQYPPSMLAALLIYCYATGRFGSRRIEEATYSDVAVRYLTGDTHPDHDTICTFRRSNGQAFRELFVKVLAVAGQSGLIRQFGGISVDGSKIKANASKHAAVSYERAGKLIEQLTLEVEELTRKAEEADSTPLEDGLTVPAEIAHRQDRIAQLEKAREVIEARCAADRQKAMPEPEQREQKPRQRRGRKPPSDTPSGTRQYNFTDPESGIMKAGSGQHFEQCYNAQLAVDVEGSMMILGARVSTKANDRQELAATVATVDGSVRETTHVLADSGFMSEVQVEAVESAGAVPYVAAGKGRHGRTVRDLEAKEDPPPPPESAGTTQKMKHRLQTAQGKAMYKLRKETVEPVIGIIKHVLGFRQFHLRGHPKVDLEWCIVCLAHNVRRLFKLSGGGSLLGNKHFITAEA